MLFSSTFNKVMDGTKTQTRRPKKEKEFAVNSHGLIIPSTHWNKQIDAVYSEKGHRKWQVGMDYAVQPGRGKKSLGRIKLLKIRLEKLHDIKFQECFKEGVEVPSWVDPDLIALGNIAYQLGNEAFKKFPITWNTLMLHGMMKFVELWDSIYVKTEFAFENNPYVWVLEFELVEKY